MGRRNPFRAQMPSRPKLTWWGREVEPQTLMNWHAASGSKVRIEAENLGLLEGIIRWKHNGRVGIQFDVNSNARAQVSSYFRFFHKEIRPVLAVRQLRAATNADRPPHLATSTPKPLR